MALYGNGALSTGQLRQRDAKHAALIGIIEPHFDHTIVALTGEPRTLVGSVLLPDAVQTEGDAKTADLHGFQRDFEHENASVGIVPIWIGGDRILLILPTGKKTTKQASTALIIVGCEIESAG